MRVMITVFPATAHFLPVVPYAWALQSAGHDVCVVFPPGYPSGIAEPDFAKVVNGAGLTAVPCGEPAPLSIHDRGYPGFAELLPTREETEGYVRALGIDDAADRATWDIFYHFAMLTIRDFHPPRPRPDIDAVIEFARGWRPDLVLWEPWFPCGAIAAGVSGAAHARVLLGPDYTGWAHERFTKHAGAAGAPESLLAAALRPLAERHGLEVDDKLLLGHWTVDPNLAGLRLPTGVPRVPSRYLPYTGATVRQDWLRERPDRPRVALTLGVSARNFLTGDWGRTAKLMEAVADLDIEVIATLNENQLEDVPEGVPDNVRVVEYVPLDQLLPTCSAIINHGAIGTFMCAVARGVPQLICDTDEPIRLWGSATADGIDWDFPVQKQLYTTLTADFVTDHGAGARLNHQTQSAAEMRDLISRVLEEPSYAEGARSIRGEWQAASSPTDIVPALERLTAQHRGGAARGD
jgi:UDP:flavonoid glycosyltransferase YjiC (YdhE family)